MKSIYSKTYEIKNATEFFIGSNVNNPPGEK